MLTLIDTKDIFSSVGMRLAQAELLLLTVPQYSTIQYNAALYNSTLLPMS